MTPHSTLGTAIAADAGAPHPGTAIEGASP
jgi:hypothetical protein